MPTIVPTAQKEIAEIFRVGQPMSHPPCYTYSMKIKNGNEVKVDGEWFVVIDCGIVGKCVKILRADSGERFEIQENEIEEWRD